VVEPETDYTWEVELTAPSAPGRYTNFFRMQTGHSVRFGHKVWADIRVTEPVEAIDVEPVELVAPVEPVALIKSAEPVEQKVDLLVQSVLKMVS